MAIELGTAYVTLLPSTKGFSALVRKELGDVEASAKASGIVAGNHIGAGMQTGTKAGVGKVGGLLKAGLIAAAAGAGLAVGAAFTDAIGKASNLEQSRGAVAAIFKGDADTILAASKTAATGLGLTQNAYNELAGRLGAGLKNKGITDFAGQTQDLIGLGADLAAQFGGSTQEAVEAIGSLMRGEADPIEKYGVSISETAIKAELAAKGQDKLKGAALEQAKAQARLSILFRQTSDAQGAFGRESDTLAGKQQRAAAQWENLQASIGEAFLPAVTDAMGFISDTAIPALEQMGGWVQATSREVQDFFNRPADPAISAVLDQLRSGFEGVWGAVEGMWTVVQPILQQVWDVIVTKWGELQPKVDSIFTSVSGIVTNVMSIIQTTIENVTGTIQLVWAVWGDEIMAMIGILMDTLVGIFDGALKVIDGIFKAWASLLKGDTQGVSDGVQQIFGGMFDILATLFQGAVDMLGQVWSGIKDSFAGPVNWVISNVINPFLDALNGLASTFGIELGLKPLDLMATGGGVNLPDGFASGGYTGPGARNQPAGIVHAGEVVFSQADVAAHGGPAVVDTFRRMRGFASGGIVPNANGWAGVDQALLQAITAWAQASGYSGGVTGNGGFRSLADQQRAYANYLAGGNLAAKPGTSMHELGLALDINPWPTAAQAAMLAQFGLGQTVGGEPWHIGLLGGGSGSAVAAFDLGAMIDGILGPLADKMKAGLGGGVMADILMGLPGMLGDWAMQKLQSVVAALIPAAGGGVAAGGVQAMAQEMAAQRGWTGAQWDALSWIVSKESGWNPNAQNPTSTAYGLFQFLNGTWGTVGASKTSDPQGQIAAGLQYIAQRHGSPLGAQAFWQNNGWYDDGGILKPGGTLAMNGTGRDEYVLTEQRLQSVAQAGNQIDKGALHDAVVAGIREGMAGAELRLTGAVDTIGDAVAGRIMLAYEGAV